MILGLLSILCLLAAAAGRPNGNLPERSQTITTHLHPSSEAEEQPGTRRQESLITLITNRRLQDTTVDPSTTTTVPPIVDDGSERLVIEVSFLVSSTSNSTKFHSVDPEQLVGMLKGFSATLLNQFTQERTRLLVLMSSPGTVNNDDSSSSSSSSSNPTIGSHHTSSTAAAADIAPPNLNNNLRRHFHRQRRHLTVDLVPNTVLVNQPLAVSTECPVSATDVIPERQSPHCNKANGLFKIDITADEDQNDVCLRMDRSIQSLMDAGYLQEVLTINYGGATNLRVLPGQMENCVLERDYLASIATTVAPSSSSSSSAGLITTIAPTIAPIMAMPTAPSPPPKPVNGWMETLDQYSGSGANNDDDDDDNRDEVEGSGNPWVDLVEQTTRDDDGDVVSTPASAATSANNGSRNYTAETQAFALEYYDDATLNLVVSIIGISLLGLLGATFCCFFVHLIVISMYAEDADEYYEDEAGNLYHDPDLQFRKSHFQKGPNDELMPLVADQEEDNYSDFDDIEEDEGEESGLFMSDSEEESSGFGSIDDDFAIDVDEDEDDMVDESGDFYVEEHDHFDEEEVGEEQSSDFFADEIKTTKRKKKSKR